MNLEGIDITSFFRFVESELIIPKPIGNIDSIVLETSSKIGFINFDKDNNSNQMAVSHSFILDLLTRYKINKRDSVINSVLS